MALIRGQPRTVLVLIDGVAAVEPVRGQSVLDRRLSLDAVARIEVLASLRGGHELAASYAFLRTDDLALTRIRDVREHVATLTGHHAILGERLGVHAGLKLRGGASEDLNRSDSLLLLGAQSTESVSDAIRVAPTALEVIELPLVPLLRTGLNSRGLFGHLDVSFWVENALDVSYSDGDIDFEARIATRPIPRPRWSATLDARVRF